jgi:WS/DGAT/MGAT family acyltransferase
VTDRLTALDAVFLNAEQPHAPLHVAGLYIFKGKPEIPGRPGLPGIFQTVADRLPLVPRYRQVVRQVPFGLGHPVWVDDPQFDLGYHLRRTALPRPGGRQELLDLVARIHARPLDRKHPLWEMYIIEGLRGGNMALYAKTHHAMVDGLAAVDVATLLLDFEPEGWQSAPAPPWAPPRTPSGTELVRDVLGEAVMSVAGTARNLVRRPPGLPSRLAPLSRVGMLPQMASMLRPTPAGPINMKAGPNRRVELVPIPLKRAKGIKNALGGTVNDVVLASVGEGLHMLLEGRGVPSDGVTYRVMVPVSVRDDGERSALGNRVAGMFAEIPVGRMPARRRLQLIQRETEALKKRKQAVASDNLMAVASWAPATLHMLAGQVGLGAQRFVNMIVSNVPALQVPMYAGGAKLLEAYPLLPLAGNLSLIICVLSYDGGMYFGIVGDWDGLPDLHVIADGVRTGFDRMERAAGVLQATAAGASAPAANVPSLAPGSRQPASSKHNGAGQQAQEAEHQRDGWHPANSARGAGVK